MAGIRDKKLAPGYKSLSPAEFYAKYRTTIERRREAVRKHNATPSHRVAIARYREKILSNPGLHATYKIKWREKARLSRAKPDNKMRALLKRHNISLEEYQLVVARQGPGCGICRKTNIKLHLDHCHETGHMRGLLCNDCNLALGRFGDNIEGLERALKYMQENF